MRKLLTLLLLATLLTSCFVKYPAIESAVVLDYSIHEKHGVFLTQSNSVSFDYKPLGSVTALQLDGHKDMKLAKKLAKADYFNDGAVDKEKDSNWLYPTREAVLEAMCKKAKEIGANGIIDLRIYYKSNYIAKGYIQEGYEATGMAIKK